MLLEYFCRIFEFMLLGFGAFSFDGEDPMLCSLVIFLSTVIVNLWLDQRTCMELLRSLYLHECGLSLQTIC